MHNTVARTRDTQVCARSRAAPVQQGAKARGRTSKAARAAGSSHISSSSFNASSAAVTRVSSSLCHEYQGQRERKPDMLRLRGAASWCRCSEGVQRADEAAMPSTGREERAARASAHPSSVRPGRSDAQLLTWRSVSRSASPPKPCCTCFPFLASGGRPKSTPLRLGAQSRRGLSRCRCCSRALLRPRGS